MIMAKILGTLPSKYNAFISAWDSVRPVEQTLLLLRERLRKEADVNRWSKQCYDYALQEGKRGRHHRWGTAQKENCSFCSKIDYLAKYCFAKKKALKIGDKDNDKMSGFKYDNSINFTAFIACQANDSSTENSFHITDSNLTTFLKLDEKYIWKRMIHWIHTVQ